MQKGKKFLTRENARCSPVEKDILKTARSYGRIDTIVYDRRDVKVTEFVYIEDGYIVSYKEMKGKPVRKVYRLSRMIGDS